MSLTKQRTMTEKNQAAHRRNGPRSRGPVTAAGRARAAAAHFRYGFYSQDQDGVLEALGEDPRQRRQLLDSLHADLQPVGAFEQAVVGRIGSALWRLQRVDRIHEGVALQRVEAGVRSNDARVANRLLAMEEQSARLQELHAKLAEAPDYRPSAEERADCEEGFREKPPQEIRRLGRLLEILALPEAESAARAEARQELLTRLADQIRAYEGAGRAACREMFDSGAPAYRAALMAPREQDTTLLQRMEDSSARQLWRFANLLMKIRGGVLRREQPAPAAGPTGDRPPAAPSSRTASSTERVEQTSVLEVCGSHSSITSNPNFRTADLKGAGPRYLLQGSVDRMHGSQGPHNPL